MRTRVRRKCRRRGEMGDDWSFIGDDIGFGIEWCPAEVEVAALGGPPSGKPTSPTQQGGDTP